MCTYACTFICTHIPTQACDARARLHSEAICVLKSQAYRTHSSLPHGGCRGAALSNSPKTGIGRNVYARYGKFFSAVLPSLVMHNTCKHKHTQQSERQCKPCAHKQHELINNKWGRKSHPSHFAISASIISRSNCMHACCPMYMKCHYRLAKSDLRNPPKPLFHR